MTHRRLAAGLAGAAVIAVGGFAAVGASGQAPDTAVVKQKFSLEMKPNRYIKDNMRFDKDVYTVKSGGTLKVVLNQPQEGPHTVTLVKKGDLPTTAQEAFEGCKVCNAMLKAHGVDFNSDEPPKFQFVENGKGQKKPSNFDRPGDSGVTPPKKGSSFSVPVTAKPGSTRYMLCVIHAQMQAKLVVK